MTKPTLAFQPESDRYYADGYWRDGDLWSEFEHRVAAIFIRSVTANTRQDGERFLALADRFHIVPTTIGYPMAEAPQALADLAHGRFGGAAVLHNQLTGQWRRAAPRVSHRSRGATATGRRSAWRVPFKRPEIIGGRSSPAASSAE